MPRVRGVLACLAVAAFFAASCDDDSNENCLGVAGRDGGAGTGGAAGRADGGGGAGTGGGAAGTDGGAAGADAGGGDAMDGAALALDDGQIAGVMIEANSGEVHAAAIASGRTKTASVRAFATMMTMDHLMANQSLVAVLDAQSLLAADSAVRRALTDQAEMALSTLWSASAAGFNVAYADSQVSMHTMVLGLLDDVLIPKAQNAALKTDLQAARAKVAMHLAEAQALRASLNADGGAGEAGATDGGADGGDGGDGGDGAAAEAGAADASDAGG
jgi:predicted outer membrane protein